MIRVTRLNGEDVVINAALIEYIEATPDTLISMATGHKLMVRESVDEVIGRSVAFMQRIGLAHVIIPPAPVFDERHRPDSEDETAP